MRSFLQHSELVSSGMRSLRKTTASITIVLLLAAAWFLADRQPAVDTTQSTAASSPPTDAANQQHLSQEPEDRPIESRSPSDGFASSDACRECHAEQYTTWHDSYHRRMTQVASPPAVIGDFEIGSVAAYDRTFALSRRGDEFWVKMHDPEHEVTAATEPIKRQIVLTTGSHHMQIYWYATGEGRSLAQLPVAWLRETNEWVPTSALFISPPGQPLRAGKRRWNEVCIKCHTTHGQPRIDDSRPTEVDTLVAEFGISCEACHGPGEAHIARKHNLPLTGADHRDVIHPGTVHHQKSAQICGQCHGIWIEKDDAGLARYLWEGRAFRAGDELSAAGHVFGTGQPHTPFIDDFLARREHYLEDRFWSDGMPRVSGSEYNSLARSPCFTRGSMSCNSCHEMHQPSSDSRSRSQWANDQLKSDMLGQEACLQCHEQYRGEEGLTAHTHHLFGSSGSQCYNCHMPHTTYGLLKAIRSHQISSPSVQESVEFGRPNACNQCHLDKSLAWTADHLSDWYGMPRLRELSADQQRYAGSVLWSLSGDAGQRALAAWSLGWQPAQQASSTDWIAPVLAQLLTDPYEAVRHIAHRSLRTLPGFENFEYRYTGPADSRAGAAAQVFQRWQREASQRAGNTAVLLSPEGGMLREEFTRLFRARDDREMLLAE